LGELNYIHASTRKQNFKARCDGAHCNFTNQEAEVKGIMVGVQPKEKVSKTHTTPLN
jgi:hypothetical protein